jgi:hypothetical protein
MPNQVEPGTMGGAPPESGGSGSAAMSAQTAYGSSPDVGAGAVSPAEQSHGPTGDHATFHGRPVSWVAVGFILAGFLTGGLSLVFVAWPTFWVGVGLAVIGGLLATASDIFEDWY